MKLAFSTLGVPGAPLSEVVALAADHGYQGVELRAHPEEPVHPGLGTAERRRAAEEFRAAGVEVLAVAGYARVAAPGSDGPVLAELRALLGLARDLGARHVRVFPGAGERPEDEADADAVRRLAAVAPYAAELGVRLLVETHDSHRTGAAVARLLGRVEHGGVVGPDEIGHGAVGAIWDVLHPWLGGEEPTDSYAALAPHLAYVQLKDVASADDTTPLPLGAGVLPLTECLGLLSRAGWDGWLCWEYEKRWYPRVPELAGLLGAAREWLRRLPGAAP
ncbi:sugar phosphate isomerase/epimerase [Streptomyces sp. LX-29]|uniref:sugar phosphate isomerase/epimerase family protein n=1 Tax=Streptomyces sp. LX-29 TaxID=2900152 RepID=UPI00240DE42B|nr:sugar phosphate isomerase/epimerase family protein [Streptomyces sp. LX-29]WFB09430.1 sugar phosphate isomerase/epimerase [Streptomyces sp. LX-29]